MKHTKGPWEIKENEKHETPSIYAGWKHIARLKDQPGELYANARLIAVAPDLLSLAEAISLDPYALTPDQWATEACILIDKVKGGNHE